MLSVREPVQVVFRAGGSAGGTPGTILPPCLSARPTLACSRTQASSEPAQVSSKVDGLRAQGGIADGKYRYPCLKGPRWYKCTYVLEFLKLDNRCCFVITLTNVLFAPQGKLPGGCQAVNALAREHEAVVPSSVWQYERATAGAVVTDHDKRDFHFVQSTPASRGRSSNRDEEVSKVCVTHAIVRLRDPLSAMPPPSNRSWARCALFWFRRSPRVE